MRLGATLVHLAPGPPYPVAAWAKRLAGAGFESLWAPEIIGRGLSVPDPLVALAVAAAVTDTIGLGTATLQLPLHHPADLGHRIRSLRSVAGERLSVGVSPGSTEADYSLLERDYAARFRTFDENLARLRASLPGEQPLLLGSWGAKVERAAREFDGWLASGFRRTPEEIIAAHARYRAAGGRRAIVCAIPVDGGTDLGETGEVLRRYADAGFDEAVVLIQPGGPEPAQIRDLLT